MSEYDEAEIAAFCGVHVDWSDAAESRVVQLVQHVRQAFGGQVSQVGIHDLIAGHQGQDHTLSLARKHFYLHDMKWEHMSNTAKGALLVNSLSQRLVHRFKALKAQPRRNSSA